MSKRLTELKALIDKEKFYSIEEAIELIKKTSTTKFDASVELHARLGINPKKGDQQVRGTIILPHGTGKTKKIAVFAEDDKAQEAKEAGADFVYDKEDITKIKKTGKIEFEVAVATPSMMKNLAIIAQTLGPKGLMPSPKNETVTPNIKKAVEELKKGKVNFKNDDTANLHQIFGKASFENKQLIENLSALLEAIKQAKPEGSKGIYLKSLTVCSSMGPGIKIEIIK